MIYLVLVLVLQMLILLLCPSALFNNQMYTFVVSYETRLLNPQWIVGDRFLSMLFHVLLH